MRIKSLGSIGTAAVLIVIAFSLTLAGCGSSGGISTQVVSGVAAAGAALAGQVSLKDASATPQVKTAVIGSDGTFAIDVTGMKAPYVLQATGTAGGTAYTLYSYAAGTGTANINPLANAMVASAAGVSDPAQIYASPDPATLQKIGSNLPSVASALMTQLQPLLQQYGAQNTNPITTQYKVNQPGLDEMFDYVTVTIANGTLTVTNTQTGGVIFTCQLANVAGGTFTGTSMPAPPAAPAAPTGVTATGGAGQVTLSWTGMSGMTSYNVYWSATSGVTTATGTKIANVTSPYVQTGLAAGTTYYYVVTAVNSGGESAPSAQVSATTSSTPSAVPAAPTGVMATGGTNQVTIAWTAVSGATSYNIYYGTATGVTTATGTKIANAMSPAVQTGLAAGTTYYYVVTAVNSAGESAPSVQVAATTLNPAPTPTVPAAPMGVMATGGTNQATISWTAVTGATSYNVYWSTTSGVTTTSGTRIAGATSPYVQTGLAAGTTYYYVVTAVNSAGESTASAQVSATTNPPPPAIPAAPTGVTATGGANQVTVSWSAVSGATAYNVYWSTTSGVTTATGTKIAGATSPCVQTGLAAGTTYYYVVTAVNSAGESAASSQVSATTAVSAPTLPAAPTGMTATGQANQATVSWSAVTGATAYNIYWSTTSGVTTATGTKIVGATSPYVQLGLTASTTYYYIVTAVSSAGEGSPSAQVSATTTSFDGATFYTGNCAGCHGPIATSSVKGATPMMIQTGISMNYGGMGKFSYLTSDQIQAISTALQ